MALHEGSEFVNGQPKDTNLDTYTMLRMGDLPELEIEFLPSTETPVGLGEAATHPDRDRDRECDLGRLGRSRIRRDRFRSRTVRTWN